MRGSSYSLALPDGPKREKLLKHRTGASRASTQREHSIRTFESAEFSQNTRVTGGLDPAELTPARHSYVRRNAVMCVFSIVKSFGVEVLPEAGCGRWSGFCRVPVVPYLSFKRGPAGVKRRDFREDLGFPSNNQPWHKVHFNIANGR